MKVHYPKLYNMAHLLALNVLLLPKDLTFFFYLLYYTFIERATFLLYDDAKIMHERNKFSEIDALNVKLFDSV